ncbi:hypothetical protein [Bradyrhizobium sp. CCGB01]|nr:hypothetical protein [Bradyrhizobium sp. CCGB01]MCP3411512.1 hypothetical protein [Bradyrhizobium sp. CCGB01]
MTAQSATGAGLSGLVPVRPPVAETAHVRAFAASLVANERPFTHYSL